MRNDLKSLKAKTSEISRDYPLLLGIDLEGINEDLTLKGVNLKLDRVTEIGAVLWDPERKAPLKIFSELVNEMDRLPLTEEVIELTGIDEQMIEEFGLKEDSLKNSLIALQLLMNRADYIVAHNGDNYDRPMLGALFQRNGLKMPDKTWLDTGRDIEFPNKIKIRSLSGLEHAHGFVNPFSHRAVTDTLSMMKILSQYELERVIKLAKSPKVTVVAKLDAPNWKDREAVDKFNQVKNKVSRAKFRWNPQQKIWTKEIHQVLIDEGKVKFDFQWDITNK